MWRRLQAHGHWHGEIWNRRRNGEVYRMVLHPRRAGRAGHVTHYVGIFTDITELKAARQLEHIATSTR